MKEFINNQENELNDFQEFIKKAQIIFEDSKNLTLKKKNQNMMTFYTAERRFKPILQIDDNCEIFGYKTLLKAQYKNPFLKYEVPTIDFSRDEKYFFIIKLIKI